MLASDSREVIKYTRMLSTFTASRESEVNVVFSSSTEEKHRRGDLSLFNLSCSIVPAVMDSCRGISTSYTARNSVS